MVNNLVQYNASRVADDSPSASRGTTEEANLSGAEAGSSINPMTVLKGFVTASAGLGIWERNDDNAVFHCLPLGKRGPAKTSLLPLSVSSRSLRA